MSHRVMREDEISPLVRALIANENATQHQEIHRLIGPALLRFAESSDEEQSEFRDLLSRFISLYDFISQIVDFTDVNLERDYRYSRVLRALLPEMRSGRIDLGSQVELTHLRISETFKGSASLDHGDGEMTTVLMAKKSRRNPSLHRYPQSSRPLNDRFGTDFDENDQLFVDQVDNDLQEDETVRAQAQANSLTISS